MYRNRLLAAYFVINCLFVLIVLLLQMCDVNVHIKLPIRAFTYEVTFDFS